MHLRVLVLLAISLASGCSRPSDSTNGTATVAVEAGQQTYERYCFSCHSMGAAGAPRLGDSVAWAPRIAKGSDALLASAISGVPPGMPAKGMCVTCSEADLKDAIAFMVKRSQ